MVLLQTGRRLAAATFRRESHECHEDNFTPSITGSSDLENAATLLNHIKFILRRRAAAVAALDADHPSESIRHFSKIIDSRRGIPSSFAAQCLIGRAAAYKSAGRITDSISDCNRALALDPSSIPAMRARADLLESIRSFSDCLRDLDHLKLLYDAILRDRKLPGPSWRQHNGIRYGDIGGDLKKLTTRIQTMRQKLGKGEVCSVDYYKVVGVKMGCTRSELEMTHRLLSLKHRPDRSSMFVDRLELIDEHRDVDMVKDDARTSALILYRLLQKGYSSIMSDVLVVEAAEMKRVRDSVAITATTTRCSPVMPVKKNRLVTEQKSATVSSITPSGFCRELAVVGSLLSQVGFNQSIPVNLEALSC